MALDPVKIPQNVYVEDRIIGPITLRQLIITGIGAGISYALYASVTKAGVTNVIGLASCWIPAVIAAAFSFLKINDLTLFNIILLMIESTNKPSRRTWVSGSGLSINIITKAPKSPAKEFEEKRAKAGAHIADVTRELKEREQKLKELTAEQGMSLEMPIIEETPKVSEPSALPVNPRRVKAESLDPIRSVDGVLTREHMHHLSQRTSF